MINRSPTTTPQELNITGSSTFGRYPKISQELTQNMFVSDGWLVPYAGYQTAIDASIFGDGLQGRGLHASAKLNRLIVVISNGVYLVNISFNQQQQVVDFSQAILIGKLQTSTGVVYISENNKPQILISDNTLLYVYDPSVPSFSVATKDGTLPIDFIPGYIDFHDTYFLCAASSDGFFSPVANNTWRLSEQNNGLLWPDDAAHIGFIQTKPDNTQAVVRFPSKGNLIFVFGKTVAEPWYDVGYQIFPYQRSTSFNVDYGCLNPTTIAAMDELVVWLGINEKGGPVVMYSDGGMPQQITTDGFDYILSNMQNPSDSQGFLYRQDGHLFYHINFYTDNYSFFVDFLKDGTKKIYNATDENGNYFIASQVAFFNNQYYFITRNNGNLYVFDTIYTTYDGLEIPRTRICKAIRNIKQEPFIANDVGFTIESGETNPIQQNLGPIYLTTQDTMAPPIFLVANGGVFEPDVEPDEIETTCECPIIYTTDPEEIDDIKYGQPNCESDVILNPDPEGIPEFFVPCHLNENYLITQSGNRLIAQQADIKGAYCAPARKLITQGSVIYLVTQNGDFLITQDDNNLVAQQLDTTDINYLIANQPFLKYITPRVDLAISIDGGQHFSSYDSYYLPDIGQRKNKLQWWQLGDANDLVCKFNFIGMGRFVATDGQLNARQ